MKKLVLVLALTLAGCCGSLEKRTVKRVQANLDLIQEDHIERVKKDGVDADGVGDWEALYKATRDVLGALETQAGD